jgi:hypothetical protein
MQETTKSNKKSMSPYKKTFELYKLIVEENRHLHQVWIDNFRIILTFNSILLAGAFTLLTILKKGGFPVCDPSAFNWSLRIISIIGIIATLVIIHIIRRTSAITRLRLKEMRYLESILFDSGMAVFPFEEGAIVMGIPKEKTFLKDKEAFPYPVQAMKFNPLGGLGGYFLIGASFILSYIVIFTLSLS